MLLFKYTSADAASFHAQTECALGGIGNATATKTVMMVRTKKKDVVCINNLLLNAFLESMVITYTLLNSARMVTSIPSDYFSTTGTI